MGVRDLARRLAAPHDERLARLEEQVAQQAEQLARHRARLDRQQGTLDRQANRLDRQQTALERQANRLDRQARQVAEHLENVAEIVAAAQRAATTTDIVASQVASIETRLADLSERSATVPHAAPGDEEAARTLLDEVRAEHRRVRERFGVVAAYEERLRRVEEAVVTDTEQTLEEFVRVARGLAKELRADGPDDAEEREQRGESG